MMRFRVQPCFASLELTLARRQGTNAPAASSANFSCLIQSPRYQRDERSSVTGSSMVSRPSWARSNIHSPLGVMQAVRSYTPMTPEEEEKEKSRVAHLSPEEKDAELRRLNREIAKYEMLRGINTGELYTWTGKYKYMAREYGMPMLIYYWALYGTMFTSVYFLIDFGGIDAMDIIGRVDSMMGWSLTEEVNPKYGKFGVTLIMNELLEPIRIPIVVLTLKPVLNKVSPPKY